MAIKLPEQYKGLTANYWRIDNFSYDDHTDTAAVHLWLYADSDSATEGNGLKREVLTISGIKDMAIPESADTSSPRNLIKQLLYTKIMESVMVDSGEVDENDEPIMVEGNKWASGTEV